MSYSAPNYGPRWTHTHAIGTSLMDALPHWLTSPSASATYPTADLAIYVPLRVRRRVVVRQLYVGNGAAVSGNFDVGLYDAGGTRLVSAGATLQAGTSTEQVVDVADTTIGPGIIYVAVTLDNITGTFIRDADAAPIAAAAGILTEQLGAGGVLPSSATWAVPQTLAYVPACGMLLTTLVT